MVRLAGMNALITGAGRGIGSAVAKALAEKGVNLAICGRKTENLERISGEIEKTGVKIIKCPADLSKTEEAGAVLKTAVEGLGGLDILINNAGMAFSAPVCETSTEQWDSIMAVNARAPFILCRDAIPYLKKSAAPSIINITSVVGTKGYVNQAAYTASKHALTGFTKVLAQEVHKYGIRVHIIAPGGVATDMVTSMRPDIDTSELILPEEIAGIVVFLLENRGNAVIDEIAVRRASKTPWN